MVSDVRSSLGGGVLTDMCFRWKRVTRRAIFIPFGVASGFALGLILTLSFCLEAYVGDIYDGPFKTFVVFTNLLLNG
jgi:hypothetical protein